MWGFCILDCSMYHLASKRGELLTLLAFVCLAFPNSKGLPKLSQKELVVCGCMCTIHQQEVLPFWRRPLSHAFLDPSKINLRGFDPEAVPPSPPHPGLAYEHVLSPQNKTELQIEASLCHTLAGSLPLWKCPFPHFQNKKIK